MCNFLLAIPSTVTKHEHERESTGHRNFQFIDRSVIRVSYKLPLLEIQLIPRSIPSSAENSLTKSLYNNKFNYDKFITHKDIHIQITDV